MKINDSFCFPLGTQEEKTARRKCVVERGNKFEDIMFANTGSFFSF